MSFADVESNKRRRDLFTPPLILVRREKWLSWSLTPMPVSTDRLCRDFERIAAITQTPGAGATRPTFSREWGEAVAYVVKEAEAAGCVVRRDAAGNVFAKSAGLAEDERTWLVGSHLDTVPHGGDYDGVAGVLAGLELLRGAGDSPVELVIFAEEEGPTFGLGMLGSRALVGDLTADDLAKLRNAEGQTYVEAGKPFGVYAAKIADRKLDPSRHLGLIELHIEQGPGLWRRDERLAVVTAIAGRRQYGVSIRGEANHAGATAMTDRRDALAAAAEMVVALEACTPGFSSQAVVTVGRMNVRPNAVNVIVDRVEFTVDFRAPDDETLARGDGEIRRKLADIARRRNVELSLEQTEAINARPMNATLVERLRRLSNAPAVVSGALHDAAVMAPHLPTVMLFVPSRGGISHNLAEFSRVEDVAAAVEVIEKLVRTPTLSRLNAMGRDDFVNVCGGLFEGSPWIAQRAYDRRPFASVADLHDKLCAVVAEASGDEQSALVRAHPDLVGRLAREGRLTSESTAEQRAAGLTDLSSAEVEAFERNNTAYRDKFGFPFVICARENRKDAILAAFPIRLANGRDAELRAALAEVGKIARLRLIDAVWEDV